MLDELGVGHVILIGHSLGGAVALQAAEINVPALIIHGALDQQTRPAHSERVFAALRGPKELLIVPDAGHNDALNSDVWTKVERWIAKLGSGLEN